MGLKEEQRRVLELLAQHEEAIAVLYRLYADRLGRQAELWAGLAEEEMGHAKWIRELGAKVEAGSATFDRGRFSTESLTASLAYVKEETARAREGTVSAVEALSTGVDIESGLIDRRFFEVFEGDSPEVQRALGALKASTREHRDRLQGAWEEARGGGREE